MSWLTSHLETFVKPDLGYIPQKGNYTFLTEDEMRRVKSIWKSVKIEARGRTILLPGRDVWIFEVLARREGYPTWFIPQCSRMALPGIEIPDIDKYFLMDTGFMGSIPAGLGTTDFKLISFTTKQSLVQVFPSMKGSRSLALKIESLPKYWKSGFLREGFVGQELSSFEDFGKAAILTQEIYCDSTRTRIESASASETFHERSTYA